MNGELTEPLAMDLSKLKSVRPSDLMLRFGFGAAIALVAGIVGLRFGPYAGGLFLAFPAVLPASLTLIEKKEGVEEASIDAGGAVMGAIGLTAFAIVAAPALTRMHFALAIALASATWILVAGGIYLLARWAVGRRRPNGRAHGAS